MELINHPELNKYYVSKTGEIYDMNKKIKNQSLLNGYKCIKVNSKTYLVHRLVALTYANNPNNCNTVNHIDENKTNNNATNLEWVTQKENCNKHTKIISHDPLGHVDGLFNLLNNRFVMNEKLFKEIYKIML
jgi:hypothetical protein